MLAQLQLCGDACVPCQSHDGAPVVMRYGPEKHGPEGGGVAL